MNRRCILGRRPVDRAFSPFVFPGPYTQAIDLGWYGAGPMALQSLPSSSNAQGARKRKNRCGAAGLISTWNRLLVGTAAFVTVPQAMDGFRFVVDSNT